MKWAHQVSFLWTNVTFLVNTLSKGLRFSEFPVLRKSDTYTWLLQGWKIRFDVMRLGGLESGQHSCLWLTKEQNVLKEIESGKNN